MLVLKYLQMKSAFSWSLSTIAHHPFHGDWNHTISPQPN
jgi:hypothetical protein